MAIQMRRGLEVDFNPDKMKPGEWAVSLDKKYVRMCFTPGLCFRMATYESFEEDMQEIQNILTSVNSTAENARNSADVAQSNATLSKSYAKGGTGTREGEDTDNAKYYYEQAKAVTNIDIATTEKAGIVKPDGTSVTVDPDGKIHANTEALSDIGDVNIQNPLDKQALVYDAASGKWKNGQGSVSSVISDEWNASTTYAVGQYCIHNNILWKCLVANTNIEPTEGTYWTKVSVANEIASVSSSLNNLSDNYVLKTQISNPNLFDNPWLTINQRGLMEYNNSNSYCFDRWIFQNMSESASININENNTVSITTKNNDGIYQVLSKRLEIGETYTISFNDGYRISSKTFVYNGADIVLLYDGAATVNFAVTNNGTVIYPYIRYEDTVATGNIVSFKLEKGSISTLAMDTDPNYALELIKCSMSTADPADTYANKTITFS